MDTNTWDKREACPWQTYAQIQNSMNFWHGCEQGNCISTYRKSSGFRRWILLAFCFCFPSCCYWHSPYGKVRGKANGVPRVRTKEPVTHLTQEVCFLHTKGQKKNPFHLCRPWFSIRNIAWIYLKLSPFALDWRSVISLNKYADIAGAYINCPCPSVPRIFPSTLHCWCLIPNLTKTHTHSPSDMLIA